MKKKLYKSREQKMISGVCGGLAEYMGWDATLVRLAFAILTILGLSGVIIYIVAAIIIPVRPDWVKPESRFVDAEYEINEDS